MDGDALRSVRPVALGSLEGVALGFTDVCPLEGRALLFAAAAEAGGSTYDDGAVAGSVVGLLEDDQVRAVWRVAGRDKIEGLWAQPRGAGVDLWLVADADDPGVRAPLYAARIEHAALADARARA